MSKETVKLKVIPEPAENTRPVMVPDEGSAPFPFFAGREDAPDMVCGLCGAVLVTGMHRHQISNLVMKCAACGSFNDTSAVN